jgi:hypothetical protein
MFLEAENNLSEGADEAGTHRNFLAISANKGKTGSCTFHHAKTSILGLGRGGNLKKVSNSIFRGVAGPSRPRRPVC